MLKTISKVAREFNISTRTLRYYEQIGLVSSAKRDGYAYRVYDEESVRRLEQIIVLRKLRIPLKQIDLILQSESASEIIDTFRRNLSEVDEEITALSTIRGIIAGFIDRLNESIARDGARIKLRFADDTALLEAADALTPRKTTLKADVAAEELREASEKLNRLSDRDVRIIYLPPMTVAAIHAVGQDEEGNHAEYTSSVILDDFIAKANLKKVYPAARCFGFNNPDAVADDDPNHGYERWISIPDDMTVPAPLVKKRMDGGLYAARAIPMGAWDEGWLPLHSWVENNSDRYIWRFGTMGGAFDVCGWLEEHLNYWQWNDDYEGKATNQLDLLMPIKPRFAAGTGHPQEKIVDTFSYNGLPVEVAEWGDTIWCGKIGYADNSIDEPNVNDILSGFMELNASRVSGRMEPDWDACVSLNYLSAERPNGVMFAFLVGVEEQPAGFDVIKIPAGRYMRVSLDDEAAFAVGDAPWRGGIPPYKWVGQQLAPVFGYGCGDDSLPFFEYYGYYNQAKCAHEFRYLYVPVRKI